MTDKEIFERIIANGADIVLSLGEDNWLAGVKFTPLLVARMLEVAYANGREEEASSMAGEARNRGRDALYRLCNLIRVYGGDA